MPLKESWKMLKCKTIKKKDKYSFSDSMATNNNAKSIQSGLLLKVLSQVDPRSTSNTSSFLWILENSARKELLKYIPRLLDENKQQREEPESYVL